MNNRLPNTEQNGNLINQLESMIDERVEAALRRCGIVGPNRDCRTLRIVRGLTISDTALRAGISHVALGKIESGKTRNPCPDTLNKIARALGVPEAEYRQAFLATRKE